MSLAFSKKVFVMSVALVSTHYGNIVVNQHGLFVMESASKQLKRAEKRSKP
jgi:hypothetical protein